MPASGGAAPQPSGRGFSRGRARNGRPSLSQSCAPVGVETLVAPEELRQAAPGVAQLAVLREPVPVGEDVGAERGLQPAAERVEAHVRPDAVIRRDEPSMGIAVAERKPVLVGPEGPGAVDRMAQEGEAEVVPRLGMRREYLVQRPPPDQPGAGVGRAERRDDAARSHFRVAYPEIAMPVRQHLLRPEVGPASGRRQQGQRRRLVPCIDGGGQRRGDRTALRFSRTHEPPRQHRERAAAERAREQAPAPRRGEGPGEQARGIPGVGPPHRPYRRASSDSTQ